MQGLITLNRIFFVRNNSVSLNPNPSDWRLTVEGDAVTEPMELTYDDIRCLPNRTLTSYVECAGNHRAMFDLMVGQKTSGTQWITGAVGNGEWVGAATRDPGSIGECGLLSTLPAGFRTMGWNRGLIYESKANLNTKVLDIVQCGGACGTTLHGFVT